jgi:hypothetical protein
MLREVEANQKQLDKARENYTFLAIQTTRELDSTGTRRKSRPKSMKSSL